MNFEAQIHSREYYLRELPKGPGYQTARHEIMHGLIYPYDVLYMDVIPNGNILGVTLMRRADNVARAAGIVHGEGFSHDLAMIRESAMYEDKSPDLEVTNAVVTARAILTGKEGLIDLMARELAIRGKLSSSSEFIDLFERAKKEIDGKREEPVDWMSIFGEKPEQEEEIIVIELPDNDPFSINIPKLGKYELTITTKDGKKVFVYENGAHIKTEKWVRMPDTDEPENYGETEIHEPQYEIVSEEYISIFFPDNLPKQGIIYSPADMKVERNYN